MKHMKAKFNLISLLSFLKLTNNDYYFNLLLACNLNHLSLQSKKSQKKHHCFTVAEIRTGHLKINSLREFKKIIQSYTQNEAERVAYEYLPIDPKLSLLFLRYIKAKHPILALYRIHLSPRQKNENYLIQAAQKNPLIYFNLYNHYMLFKQQLAEKSLNDYLYKNQLSLITKIDPALPLYISNMMTPVSLPTLQSSKVISIIMSAKNEASLICYSIESLVKQTYQNIEIIFIDDASIDNTSQLFLETCKKYNFTAFQLIQLKESKGPLYCRNLGLQQASGDYLTFHDADDWAHPQRLEFQLKSIIDNHALASMSELIRVQENGLLFSRTIYPINKISPVSLLFKREVLTNLGYFYTDLLGVDTEYYLRIELYYGTKKLIKLNKVLTIAALRENSRTTAVETGVTLRGVNPKRVAHYEELMLKLYRMRKKKYYVHFSKDQSSI